MNKVLSLTEVVEIFTQSQNHLRSCRCKACLEARRLWAELVRDAEQSTPE
jgi:hypothetical protein